MEEKFSGIASRGASWNSEGASSVTYRARMGTTERRVGLQCDLFPGRRHIWELVAGLPRRRAKRALLLSLHHILVNSDVRLVFAFNGLAQLTRMLFQLLHHVGGE